LLQRIDGFSEYANKNQLQQDHPCVIRLIKQKYLRQPSSKSLPYRLGDPQPLNPSDGPAQGILRILRNQVNLPLLVNLSWFLISPSLKTKGFFVECGAYDGEFLSNTLYMERSFQWSGLLIEADQISHSQLVNRRRRAYTSPVCLSTKPYPMEVSRIVYFSWEIIILMSLLVICRYSLTERSGLWEWSSRIKKMLNRPPTRRRRNLQKAQITFTKFSVSRCTRC
jgi:hypothetical protein